MPRKSHALLLLECPVPSASIYAWCNVLSTGRARKPVCMYNDCTNKPLLPPYYAGSSTPSAPAVKGGDFQLPEGNQWRYSEFINAVQSGKVERVRFSKEGGQLQVALLPCSCRSSPLHVLMPPCCTCSCLALTHSCCPLCANKLGVALSGRHLGHAFSNSHTVKVLEVQFSCNECTVLQSAVGVGASCVWC